MEKYVRCIILFVLTVTLIGCGSAKNEIADNKAKVIAFDTLSGLHGMEKTLFIDGLPYVPDTPFYPLLEETQYYKIKGSITSMKALKERIERWCTPEFADKVYYSRYLAGDTPVYCEQEGILYMEQVAFAVKGGTVLDMEIASGTTDRIVCILTIVAQDDSLYQVENLKISLPEEKKELILVREGEEWKIQSYEGYAF